MSVSSVVLLVLLGLGQHSTAWNMRYIYGLLNPLSRFIGGQELVWFISPQLETSHLEHLNEFMQLVDAAYDVTQTVVTTNREMRMLSASARRNHVSIILTTGAKDPIMEVARLVLLRRHFYFAVFIMVDTINDMQAVIDVCDLLYDEQFFNALLYFQHANGINQLHGPKKFPDKACENRTNLMEFMRRKYDEVVNSGNKVGGYKFETALRQDLPHLFKLENHQGVRQYAGTTFRIIDTFVKHINGSFTELKMPPDARGGELVNMKQVLQAVRERRMEFSAHAYALFRSDDEVDKSYPLLVVQWCLMVPLYNSVSTYLYPLQPFHWLVWSFVVGAFVSLVLLELLWLRLRLRPCGSGSVHAALLDSFCYILNIATSQQLQQPSTLRLLLLLAIFFHSFFLSANYTSTLGSILAVNLFHAQLNTLQDIISARLPVMIIDYELEFLLQEHNELPAEFRRLLWPVDSAVFTEHQVSFNSSYAYFVTDDTWHFLDEQQHHLKRRLFKLSDICFGSYHLAYPIQIDSYLWRDLEYFTFRVHSSGLLNYYERISFEQALQAGLVQRLQENKEYTSAGMQHLAIAFIYLLVMCTLAGLIFALELLYASAWRHHNLLLARREQLRRF